MELQPDSYDSAPTNHKQPPAPEREGRPQDDARMHYPSHYSNLSQMHPQMPTRLQQQSHNNQDLANTAAAKMYSKLPNKKDDPFKRQFAKFVERNGSV